MEAAHLSCFSIPKPRGDPSLRLFCFPHAGGGAHAFRDWEDGLPDSIEIVVFNPPGRGTRHEEPLPTSMPQLVEELLYDLLPELTMPFAFFGHSFGAWVAFEVSRELRRQRLPFPAAVIASASPAPQLPLSPEKQISHLAGEDFLLAASERWGFIPQEFLDDPQLGALMIPALKVHTQHYRRPDHNTLPS